jgi:hypothetical protein
MPADDDFSRFSKTPKVSVDGKETYGQWKPHSFLTQDLDSKYIRAFKVTSATEGRPDKIAKVLYGTSLLSWVLLAYNNVTEPFGWPKSGTIIQYPIDEVVLPQIL